MAQPLPHPSDSRPADRDAAAPAQTRPNDEDQHPLSSAHLLRPSRPIPRSGWRGLVYTVSGGLIHPDESAADRARRDQVDRINQPLDGGYKIAVLSLKGGAGKTVCAALLGSTFASTRGDRVIALDANPDRGTLGQRVPRETEATMRDLLDDAEGITRYSQVRRYTSQAPSRLEVLASDEDPATSHALSREDYWRAVDLLEHFHSIMITDCGTGLTHDALQGALAVANCLLIVASPALDGARSAWATLDWLDAHGYRDLVARSVVVVNGVAARNGTVDVDEICANFARRCRAVARLPFDPHIRVGGIIDLDQLSGHTRDALLDLAAIVADDFPRSSPDTTHRRRTIPALRPADADAIRRPA